MRILSDATAQKLAEIAEHSEAVRIQWQDRGRAPRGYTKGMAVAFGQLYLDLLDGDAFASEVANPVIGEVHRDGLAFYADKFEEAGVQIGPFPSDILRSVFVMQHGLGMRESSGRYCEGRDASADNTSAETAEAGLFQCSWNARSASPLLVTLFEESRGMVNFLEIFREGVTAHAHDEENFGSGDGRDFQALTKANPLFAVRFAALCLRKQRRHWGPINTRQSEIRPEVDALFRRAMAQIEADYPVTS